MSADETIDPGPTTSVETVEDWAKRTGRRARDRRDSARRAAWWNQGWGSILLGGGHLAVLSAVAVAQPLFDLLGRNPEFFAVRGSTPHQIVVFAVALVVLPPAVLLAVEIVAALAHRGLRAVLHLLFVAVLVALIALQAAHHALDETGPGVLAVATIAGAAVALAYARLRAVRRVATMFLPVPALVCALFLFGSPVSRLVFVDEREAQAASIKASTPVVLIVFDELPTVSLMNGRQEIDASRFPNFAALARTATWFRDATTVHPETRTSVPSILTGRLTDPGKLPVAADHPNNLFTLFAESYELRAQESVTRLCPARCSGGTGGEDEQSVSAEVESLGEDLGVVYLHLVVPDTLAGDLPPVGDTWANFLGGDEEEDAQHARRDRPLPTCGRGICTFARRIGPTRKPALYFFHPMLPHVPWMYAPSGRRYTSDVRVIPGTDRHRWGHDAWLIEQGYQRHLLQVGYTDRGLGVIVERLRKTGLFDRSLVIVTADHGLSFEPGEPRRLVSAENLEALAFVPLLVKAPGQKRGRTVGGLARTVDVVPTIADALGVRVPWRVHGRSLLKGRVPRTGTVVVRSNNGERARASLSDLLTRRERALALQLELFGDGGGFEPVYWIGPSDELLGRTVASLAVSRTDARVELNDASLFRTVNLRSGLVPSYVTGTVTGAGGGDHELAVAANGRIAAVTRTYQASGETRFAAIVPDSAFVSGVNDMRVYLAEGTARLVELPGSELEFTLAGETIEASEGSPLVVRPGGVSGEVHVRFSSESAVLQGWAADIGAGRPADRLIVFVGERSVYVGRAGNTKRVEVEARYGIENAGFRAEMPAALVPKRGSRDPVRIFAASGDVASELSYAAPYPWSRE